MGLGLFVSRAMIERLAESSGSRRRLDGHLCHHRLPFAPATSWPHRAGVVTIVDRSALSEPGFPVLSILAGRRRDVSYSAARFRALGGIAI